MTTQAEAILAILRQVPEGVTAIDMLEVVGTFRLAARIHDLKRAGHRIESAPWRTPSGKIVARYTLIERPEQLALPVAR